VNNLQQDQNTEALPVVAVNIVTSRFCDGTRSVERLVACVCTRTLVLLVERLKGAVTHISADQIRTAVDANKIL
jgi:hypothetical protein